MSYSARGLTNDEWSLVDRFHQDIGALLASAPRDDDGVLHDVSAIKSKLAGLGFGAVDVPQALGGLGASSTAQAAIQFIAGYHDLDLRDAAHVGHGRLILEYGQADVVDRWAPRLVSGELVGIALTEEVGGTNVRAIGAQGHRCSDGSWTVTGRKVYVSRIVESAAFVVFMRRADDDSLAAVIVEANASGLHRVLLRQDGLRGWSWGNLILDHVRLGPENVLVPSLGDGRDLANRHFDYYRPMVSMTALGGAAAAFDTTLRILQDRIAQRRIQRPLDSSLEKIGTCFIQLQSAILASVAALHSVERGHSDASVWARTTKAYGVDIAYRSVEQLQLLTGANSYERGDPLNKVLHDLRGFMYADGIHDALLQSAGHQLLHSMPTPHP